MFVPAALIGFCLFFVVVVPVLGLPMGKAVVGVVINFIVHFLISLVVGWLAFLVVKAGVAVDGPAVFMFWTHALTSSVRLALALHEHVIRWGGAKDVIINAISGSWLALLPLYQIFAG